MAANNIGPAGAAAIEKALKHNNTLTELEYVLPLESTTFSRSFFLIQSSDLMNNNEFQYTFISFSFLISYHLKPFHLFIYALRSIWSNNIGDAGVASIAAALKHNRKLTRLE